MSQTGHITTPHAPAPPPAWLNATMRWLLRSPLSRMVDRGIILLTVTGRRTGTRYTFPVQYVEDGHTLWVMSSGSDEKRWWRNLTDGAPVDVVLRRREEHGNAVAFTHAADPAIVEEGLRRYIARFPSFAKKFGLAGDDPAAFAAHARGTVIVRIDLAP
jgi:deazaflavin-dependent oxidoreductase (nitroreductase family)